MARCTTKLDGSVYQPFIVGANGVPNWRALVRQTTRSVPANFYVTARYIEAANINNSFTTKDLNILRVPSVTYVDASFTYKLHDEANRRLETFVRVGNLLDKDPPLTNDLFGTSPTLYDVVGRTYTAGVRFGF